MPYALIELPVTEAPHTAHRAPKSTIVRTRIAELRKTQNTLIQESESVFCFFLSVSHHAPSSDRASLGE
jgi:hypothetical protein